MRDVLGKRQSWCSFIPRPFVPLAFSPVDFFSKRLYIVIMKEIETIKEIIERHKQEIAEKYHISEIGVFGSYTRGEQENMKNVWIQL